MDVWLAVLLASTLMSGGRSETVSEEDEDEFTMRAALKCGQTVCGSTGVTCQDGSLNGVDFSGMKLRGPYPEDLPICLEGLRFVRLAGNEVTGPVPQWLTELHVMEDFTIAPATDGALHCPLPNVTQWNTLPSDWTDNMSCDCYCDDDVHWPVTDMKDCPCAEAGQSSVVLPVILFVVALSVVAFVVYYVVRHKVRRILSSSSGTTAVVPANTVSSTPASGCVMVSTSVEEAPPTMLTVQEEEEEYSTSSCYPAHVRCMDFAEQGFCHECDCEHCTVARGYPQECIAIAVDGTDAVDVDPEASRLSLTYSSHFGTCHKLCYRCSCCSECSYSAKHRQSFSCHGCEMSENDKAYPMPALMTTSSTAAEPPDTPFTTLLSSTPLEDHSFDIFEQEVTPYLKHPIERISMLFARVIAETLANQKRRTYTCRECQEKVSCESALRKHYREVHEWFKCSHCHHVLKSRGDLSRHQQDEHGNKPYRCKLCPKGFPRADALRSHFAAHADLKRFQCSVPKCRKQFNDRSNCNKHVNRHVRHHIPAYTIKIGHIDEAAARHFKCHYGDTYSVAPASQGAKHSKPRRRKRVAVQRAASPDTVSTSSSSSIPSTPPSSPPSSPHLEFDADIVQVKIEPHLTPTPTHLSPSPSPSPLSEVECDFVPAEMDFHFHDESPSPMSSPSSLHTTTAATTARAEGEPMAMKFFPSSSSLPSIQPAFPLHRLPTHSFTHAHNTVAALLHAEAVATLRVDPSLLHGIYSSNASHPSLYRDPNEGMVFLEV